MKDQKGISHTLLTIIVLAIIICAFFGIKEIVKERKDSKITDLTTDMLLVQGKIRVISQENTMKKDERPLIGKKLSDRLDDEKIKKLIDKEVIKQDEEKYDSYFVIDNDALAELNLTIDLKGEYYIVNYSTYEVIHTKGMEIEGETKYKLSQLNEYQDKVEENKESSKKETADEQKDNDKQEETQTTEQQQVDANNQDQQTENTETTQEEPAE